jgi:pimeloyl-ACP methyl ester carboxylesterase
VIAGHDWGAPVAWNSALLRPDIFRAIALLSVPYFPRGSMRPTDGMKALAGDQHFYQLYFQEPGKVEKELDADPRRSMAMVLFSGSGDAPRDGEFAFLFPKTKKFIETGTMPDKLPAWLTEADLDFFAGEFKRAGFRGGVNWYRNSDRNWELTPFLDGAKLRQPAVFVAGEHDVVGKMIPGGYEIAGAFTPNLKKKVIVPGAGHWIQQERPKETNEVLIEFLKSL